MLPEVGASELIVIAAVALIVVGPKDLPVLMRKLGAFMTKMRGLASEFRASFDEMARQSELDDLRKEVEALRQGRLDSGVHADVEDSFRAIEQDLTMPGIGGEAPSAPLADEAALEADHDQDTYAHDPYDPNPYDTGAPLDAEADAEPETEPQGGIRP